MLKKIVLGTLFVGLIGVLVAGAVIRTMDRTERVAEAEGNGHGRGEASEHAEGESGQGRGGYGSQGETGDGVAERKYPNYDGSPPEEWLVHEGAVVLAPEDGVDLVIEMSDGKKLTVGTGPMYMASQGFTLQAGEPVQVLGYWEDHEFKAAQVTRLTDGRTITLRDELGRPEWAGAGRNAQNNNLGGYGSQNDEDAPGDQAGVGEAEASGLGQDSGGYGSQGETSEYAEGESDQGLSDYSQGETSEYAEEESDQGLSDYSQGEASEYAEEESDQGLSGYSQGQTGDGLAERAYPNYQGSPPSPEAWLVHEGTVVLAPEDGVDLVIEMSDGKKLTAGTGPNYMASQGFFLQAGELVQVLGYWEDNEFKTAQVTCLADGRTIILRDERGRPSWAGAGRRALGLGN